MAALGVATKRRIIADQVMHGIAPMPDRRYRATPERVCKLCSGRHVLLLSEIIKQDARKSAGHPNWTYASKEGRAGWDSSSRRTNPT